MNHEERKQLISAVRKTVLENFKELASHTIRDEGHLMVEFSFSTLHNRKINNSGREENTDRFVGIDENGWVEYVHTIAHGGGPIEILSSHINHFDDDEIISFLTGEKCRILEYLDFMKTCEKMKGKYDII